MNLLSKRQELTFCYGSSKSTANSVSRAEARAKICVCRHLAFVVEYAGFIETSSLYNPNEEHIPYLPSFSHLTRNGVLACRANFLGANA